MKLIKTFLAMLIFAVCAVFSFPLKATPKPILVPLKAEKISPEPARPAAAVNFVRTDSLVMYETIRVNADATINRQGVISVNEFCYPVRGGISKYFRFKPEFYRRVELLIV